MGGLAKKLLFLLLVVAAFASVRAASDRKRAEDVRQRAPAFPGAEGFGRFVSGGRGGAAYHVTSLKDDGSPGTFRHAAGKESDEPLTVVFDVSGTIELEKPLAIRCSNLTVAGQTAPGDGICFRNYPVSVAADNVILRFLRFRLGDAKKHEGDSLGGRRNRGLIVDHCSMSWSTDECASFYDYRDLTVQWCIVSESLRMSVHVKGAHGYGGIWGGWNASFHHNLLACHDSRNPRFSGSRTTNEPDSMTVDFRNNVVFGWGNETAYGGEGGRHNIVANYYKPAPWSRKRGFFRAYEDSGANKQPKGVWGLFHLSGNEMAGNKELTDDNGKGFEAKGAGGGAASLLRPAPFPCAPVRTETAKSAYRSVSVHAGAMPHDPVDLRILNMLKVGGAEGGGLIDSPDDVGGYPELRSKKPPKDSDGDGMPDVWERRRGLNPKNPKDGAEYAKDGSGYTNLETYLNSLAANAFPKDEEREFLPGMSADPLEQDLFDCFVSASGRGDFVSLQAAIDSAPEGREKPFHILAENGIYDELLVVPREKTGIRLHGQSRDGTILRSRVVGKQAMPGLSEKPVSVAATNVLADDFYAENVTFQNAYGRGTQALALQACGDRQAFRNCAFRSFQDTLLCRNPGTRQFFHECLIEGGVDFIYGAGSALFEECEIRCLPEGRWILAPSTRSVKDGARAPSGLVLKRCRILRAAGVKDGSYYFLRPWKDGAMAAVIDCATDGHISPAGWAQWSTDPENPDSDNHLNGDFHEFGTTDLNGNPIDLSQRASWVRKASEREARDLSSRASALRYADGETWNVVPTIAAPSAPSGLRFRNGELRWKSVPGAIGYLIERNGILAACTKVPRHFDKTPSDGAKPVWRVSAIGSNRNIGPWTELRPKPASRDRRR